MRNIFGAPRALIGMLHLGALPGTPMAREPVGALIERAVSEARVYAEARFTALMIENMHDRPYLKRAVGPEVVAAMAVIGRAVRAATNLPLGVQVLAGANREALAVAAAAGAGFIRVEGFVFAHVADEGLIEADAGELLRYRRAIGADAVAILADVKKKHSSHALTADVDAAETALAAEFALADGVILTGTASGRAADPIEVAHVSQTLEIPLLVGSGLTPENLPDFAAADGYIVGSSVKQGGLWSNPLDPASVRAMAEAFRALGPDS
ncbi:MAG: BtpA/SgcQ family protein [Candidatus Eisenbacteria bacterium]